MASDLGNQNKGGRPTVMTKEVLTKLEEAFLIGCSDTEACFYAGISTRTLYRYEEQNEDFCRRKEELKSNPFLIARQAVIKEIENENNPKRGELAIKYLERTKRDEFSLRRENVVSERREQLDKRDQEIIDYEKSIANDNDEDDDKETA